MQSDPRTENIDTRSEAKELFCRRKGKFLGLFLGFGLITMVVSIIVGLITYAVTTTAYLNGMQLTTTTNPLGFLSLLSVFLIAPIQMGFYATLIDLCRGNEAGFGGLFSRMGLWLKSIGLYLWIYVKIFLWMLAGVAAVFLCALLGSLIGNEGVTVILSLIGMVVMCVLIFPASLRYSQATYIMADDPSTGVFESVNISKAMMQGRKWQYFKLGVPYFLKYFGILLGGSVLLSILTGMLGGMLGEALGVVLMSIGALALILFALWTMLPCLPAYTLFYLKHTPKTAQDNPL